MAETIPAEVPASPREDVIALPMAGDYELRVRRGGAVVAGVFRAVWKRTPFSLTDWMRRSWGAAGITPHFGVEAVGEDDAPYVAAFDGVIFFAAAVHARTLHSGKAGMISCAQTAIADMAIRLARCPEIDPYTLTAPLARGLFI